MKQYKIKVVALYTIKAESAQEAMEKMDRKKVGSYAWQEILSVLSDPL